MPCITSLSCFICGSKSSTAFLVHRHPACLGLSIIYPLLTLFVCSFFYYPDFSSSTFYLYKSESGNNYCSLFLVVLSRFCLYTRLEIYVVPLPLIGEFHWYSITSFSCLLAKFKSGFTVLILKEKTNNNEDDSVSWIKYLNGLPEVVVWCIHSYETLWISGKSYTPWKSLICPSSLCFLYSSVGLQISVLFFFYNKCCSFSQMTVLL